jgi:1-phosphofructokinase/tagatose 6-phosphate kinase
VLAGSLPREVPEDWYATALREARRQKVYTVLDSEGEPLRLGLAGEPDLVVPNQLEAEELVGFEFETTQDFVLALEQIVEMGARGVVITRDDGALALVREAGKPLFLRATVPLLEVVSPVGAGDALLAGLLASRRAERSFAEALRYAVACGAASTQHEQPGMLDPREVQRLSSLVEVAELAPAEA